VLNDCARVQPKQTTGFSNLFEGKTHASVLYVQNLLTISKDSILNARASHRRLRAQSTSTQHGTKMF
jgi:hypothetical protein